MNRIIGFLAQVAAAAATLLAVGVVIHPAAMIFTPPVVIATLVVGVLLSGWLAVFNSSERSLMGDAGNGIIAGVIIWVVLAWVSFYFTGKFPGASMLSGDFLGRTFSVALAGVAAALVKRSTK